ncbi:hypothetical protein DEU56DRAFT_315536 [Suillus clintonianus]|uniref:uncharacterized protein n=1 Tax=Suillus clintonianus TaxID=1904413 RepID=UPI001B86E31C|nr:uncharacterized protein DEU56DRAFT_315536 [Suillus clintonianus]KAG2155613.1 hypothetical protein DEU56DRAFT_315536 [Suillus clintonianus]
MVKPTKTPKGQPPRKHKKRRLSHKDHFARLMKEAVEFAPEEVASTSSSSPDSTSTTQPAPAPNYSNILLIEKFQDALDTRTAVCRRLEILVRSSILYTPSAQARLIRCLRDDYVRGDRTRKVIDNLRHSDFISATSMANQDAEFIRKEVLESTKLFFEGSKELQEIGDQIAAQFS